MVTGSDDLPWWKTAGLVYAGGWHPITGRIRGQIPDEFVEEDYAWEYTQEHIGRLKELGVTLLIGQFDRGLSDTDQAEDVERARLLADLCHRHGLRHGSYLANTVYFESMLKQHPECEDWVVKAHDGRMVHYGGEQTWRWVACFNSPGWRARMKRQIDSAIAHVKTDWLHFDNLAVWPEPDSCHCPHCQRAFKEFLLRRYPTPEKQRRRFGFPGLEAFRPPNWYLRFAKPWDLDHVRNPLMQDWIDFRCWTVADYIRELSEYARGRKPDVCIDSNGQGIWGVNQALLHGIDQESQSRWVDVICDENPDFRPEDANAEDDPRACYPVEQKMRTMNYCRRLGKQVWSAYRDEEELAFHLTFAGDPGINHAWGYAEPGRKPLNPPQPGVRQLLDHHRRHVHLYTRVSAAARTAVWRGRQSLAYVSTETHLSACVMEQVLFRSRIPFSIVTDGFVDDQRLRDFDLVILPDVEFVGELQVAALTRFVARGGALLITERSGQYTSEPRRRREAPFAHLFQQTQDFANHGDGRVAYLPRIDYVHPPRTFKSAYNVFYDGIDTRYWKEPYNVSEILSAIRWLYPACRPVEGFGSAELRLDLVSWPDGWRGATLIRCGRIDGERDIPFAVLAEAEPRDGQMFLPGQPDPLPLKWTRRSGQFHTILSRMVRHAVVRYR